MSDDLAVEAAIQMCAAPSDGFTAGEWCFAANVLAEQLAETREALVDLRETAAPRDWETPGHPMNDWTKREPILRKIDQLLSSLAVSPADTTEGTG